MKTSYSALTAVLFLLACPDFSFSVSAQPPGFRGGERGAERGDRGGRGRGDRGGDRADRGDERSGRGGPPGGGFRGRGGPPGGGRGGFDPSSMIDRMDSNSNGMIDPDEMQGPAQMMISRLQREDPSIRTDSPVPVSKIKEAFERMRGGGGSSDRSGNSREDARAQLNDALTPPEALVPGFGEPKELQPVLGFGPAAELMSVTVTPADRKSAEESLQRYDRNKDGFLGSEEISRRWTGNPLDFDRNGDSKLSLNELAIRAARMRVAQADVQATASRRNDDRRRDRDEQSGEASDPSDGRKSFASASRALPEGLPGWFADKDLDEDHQVSMAEYARQWTSSLVEEFQTFDLNRDGVITAQECLAAVRNGATASEGSLAAATSASSNSSPSSSSWGSRGSRSGSSRGGSSRRSSDGGASPAAASAPADAPDPKTMEYAQRIIGRNDNNEDGHLTHDEWKDMLIDISDADADQDGRITTLEYAQWMQAKSQR